MKALLTLAAVLATIGVAAPAAFAGKPLGYSLIITDTLGGGGGAPVAVDRSVSGFNWVDAAVGAVTVAGSMLILLGGALVVLRRRGGLAF